MAGQFSKSPSIIILGQPFVPAKVKYNFCDCTRDQYYTVRHSDLTYPHTSVLDEIADKMRTLDK